MSSAAVTPTLPTASSFFSRGTLAIVLFVAVIALLATNIGIISKVAGSKDDWDTIKTQVSSSVAICISGSAVFAAALYLFVSQYELGNLLVPVAISVVVSSMALGVGLSALSIAAITR
jgi:hypothetical protein